MSFMYYLYVNACAAWGFFYFGCFSLVFVNANVHCLWNFIAEIIHFIAFVLFTVEIFYFKIFFLGSWELKFDVDPKTFVVKKCLLLWNFRKVFDHLTLELLSKNSSKNIPTLMEPKNFNPDNSKACRNMWLNLLFLLVSSDPIFFKKNCKRIFFIFVSSFVVFIVLQKIRAIDKKFLFFANIRIKF